MIQYIADANLPTEYGKFTIYGFTDTENKDDIVVLVSGEVIWKEDILLRVHSKCLTGDAFHSLKCDCHAQLDYALAKIGKQWGMLIYLDQEGRGIGILNKIKAYKLQEEGYDTIESMKKLWLPVDARKYDMVKNILDHFDIKSVKLLTNNPEKIKALTSLGIGVTRDSIVMQETEYSRSYLETKKHKMKHLL